MLRLTRAAAALLLSAATACSGSAVTDDADLSDADLVDADQIIDALDASGDGEVDSRPDADDGGGEIDEPEPVCDPEAELELVDRGLLEVGDRREGEQVEQCTEHRIGFVAPQGSVIEVEVTSRGVFPLVATVSYPDDLDPAMALRELRTASFGEAAAVELESSRSGEYALVIRSATAEVAQRYDVALRCLSGCELEATRYPILMVHGWTGFDDIGPIDYFYNVPEMLRDHGYWVAIAELDPYNSSEIRSEQLAPQVDEVLRQARATKVNLIAHSQGGLDSRRLISSLGYGDRVSSLTTVATPHRGTPLCDVALGLLPGAGEEVLYALFNLLGATVVGSESDAEASFYAMTQDYVQNVFNPANPDDPRVSYISWMGRTCLYGIDCDDICDIEIRWAYDIIYLIEGANDGIVPVSSAPWGDYRGEVPADHFDEVGQLFGVTNAHFDHEEFYLERARDLGAEGH